MWIIAVDIVEEAVDCVMNTQKWIYIGIMTGIYFMECLFELQIHVILYLVKVGRPAGGTEYPAEA